jgi:ABC-type transport system substrate-binding protein
MVKHHGIGTGIAVATVLILVAMTFAPTIKMGGNDVSLGPVGSTEATGAGDRVIRVGVPQLAEAIQTLNPLVYTMGVEYMLIWPCYSMLQTYDINQKVIPDLATKIVKQPDGVTYYIEIVSTAKFYDKNHPTLLNPVTVDDVIFTYNLAMNTEDNTMQYYFPVLPTQTLGLIESMTKISPTQMTMKLREPFGPITTAFTAVPILPKYVWETQLATWANFKANGPVADWIAPVIGSGPFYYNQNDIQTVRSIGVAELVESPSWFAKDLRGYDSHVNKIIFRSETEDSNLANYNAGTNDVMTAMTPEQYLGGVPGEKWTSSQGYVWEFNMNQLSDAMRLETGTGGPQDYNSQVLLDPAVKLALQMSIDKNYIATEVLNGLGSPADSLIPQVQPMYYSYGSVPGETAIAFNPSQARLDLYTAGWKWRLDNTEILSGAADYLTYYPLSKQIGGVPAETLAFRYDTPDTDPLYHEASLKIIEWSRVAGIDLQYPGPSNLNNMNTMWYNADYDTWLWNWWFVPTSEPSLDVMQVLATEAIGSWSDVYWSDPEYDALYYASLQETDPVVRKEILADMQRKAYEDSGCWPVVWADLMYAAQSVGPEFWQNYGNWNQKYALTADSAYPWLWMQIYPQDNPSPQITSFTPTYSGDTTHTITMTATVTDNIQADMLYRWNYGDGNFSAWSTSPTVTKTYERDGVYTAYFMAKEGTSADGFIASGTAQVTVIDLSNAAPSGVSFTYLPLDPDSGTMVQFSGSATDTDPLIYTWDFGDGETGYGQTTTHQFADGAGGYTVVMYADDGHLGTTARPVASNPELVPVTANRAPTISVPDYPLVAKGLSQSFVVTASDLDSRDTLRYTWVWGDGTTSVTTTVSTTHTYTRLGDYTLRVYADDLTGLTGHNVSDTGLVNVENPTNIAPVITAFSVSDTTPYTLQVLTFSGTATDANLDLLDFTFDFGDGNTTTATQTTAGQTLTVTHAYERPEFNTVRLTVTDLQATPVTSSPIYLNVEQAAYFTLNLVTGWNFVSVPLLGAGYKASTLGLNPGDTVSDWNPATRTYKSHIVGIPVNDFTIAASTGYWINVPSGTRTLDLYGSIPGTTPLSRSITVPSGGGWAIIGFNSLDTTRHAKDIPAMWSVVGGITTVATWNPVTKVYTSWLSVIPNVNNFPLVPGNAYWILCGASGTLTYTP